jgi:NAD(P)-dependent dehydrogenase (short-subunit alcohol dehydrogenase family)
MQLETTLLPGGFLMPAPAPFAQETAIVTGGSRGIGLAIARRLGGLGARVALCARSQSSVDAALRALRAGGVEALGAAADVTSADSVRSFVERVCQAFGGASILVNNAGVGVFRPALELEEADWDRVVNTNLKGAWLMSRAVAPVMVAAGRGHIIHIASLAGKNTFAGGSAYCASKWGLRGLAGCMAEELRGHGIRVSTIFPGTVHTEFSPHTGKDPERMLQPEDVAHVVEMLVRQSPQSFVSEVDLRPAQKP